MTTKNESLVIKGTIYEVLFDKILSVYREHGYKVSSWDGWPTLNPYGSCNAHGDYLLTDENDNLMKFASHLGNHPCLGTGSMGDSALAFAEIKEALGLQLVDDFDASSSFTYPGHRIRQWKITNPEFSQFA